MEITAPHPQHTEFSPVWKKCRDAATGERAIHAGGESYLPKLSGQKPDQFNAYVARASYFNATGRTVQAMTGLVFRKQPVVELPNDEWLKDINLAGLSLEGLARQVVQDVITVGREGLLVDYPPKPETEPGTALTVDLSRKMGLRPYLSAYKAEDILNWKYGRVNNASVLIWLTLTELYEEDGEVKTQIRELSLSPGYVQKVWRENKDGDWFVFDTIVPLKNGKPLSEIPFYFVSAQESDGSVKAPPIEDLVSVNISHYRNSADLENGAHVSGLPTPYVTNISDDSFVFNLGGAGLVLPHESTAGFLQCGSEGFATLEKLMDRKESQMAALGARMLAGEKKQAEAAESHSIKRGGENSVLASLVGSVEMQISRALKFMAEWDGLSGEVVFDLNKDFLPTPMTAQELTALVGAWQSGAISEHTLFEALQAGEVVSEGITFEDEQERKASQEPALGLINDDQ